MQSASPCSQPFLELSCNSPSHNWLLRTDYHIPFRVISNQISASIFWKVFVTRLQFGDSLTGHFLCRCVTSYLSNGSVTKYLVVITDTSV